MKDDFYRRWAVNTGVLSLLTISVLAFNWEDVSPHVLLGAASLTIFLSRVLTPKDSQETDPRGGWRPPARTVPVSGSGKTHTASTTPLPTHPGTTPPSGTLRLVSTQDSDQDWSVLMPPDVMLRDDKGRIIGIGPNDPPTAA